MVVVSWVRLAPPVSETVRRWTSWLAPLTVALARLAVRRVGRGLRALRLPWGVRERRLYSRRQGRRYLLWESLHDVAEHVDHQREVAGRPRGLRRQVVAVPRRLGPVDPAACLARERGDEFAVVAPPHS